MRRREEWREAARLGLRPQEWGQRYAVHRSGQFWGDKAESKVGWTSPEGALSSRLWWWQWARRRGTREEAGPSSAGHLSPVHSTGGGGQEMVFHSFLPQLGKRARWRLGSWGDVLCNPGADPRGAFLWRWPSRGGLGRRFGASVCPLSGGLVFLVCVL